MPSPDGTGGEGDPNTMRVLLATDIHLGYAEKHPVKCRDGFLYPDISAIIPYRF